MLSKENTNDSSNSLQKPSEYKNNLINMKRLPSFTRANSQSNLKKIPRPSLRNNLILNTSNNFVYKQDFLLELPLFLYLAIS